MSDYVSAVIDDWERERPDLDTSSIGVVNRLLRTGQLVQSRLDALASAHGLSHKGDLDVLTALRRSGEPYEQAPSWLARAVQLTTGGMTNRLDRLENAGLVERRPDPADRRGVLVHLTEDGIEVVDAALEVGLEEQRRILGGLDAEDRETLAALLERLLVVLGDVIEEPINGRV